jgi:hypothetical protein
MRRRRVFLVLGLISLLPLFSCGSECDKCSSDSDCDSGFVCTTFNDGSQRCGSGHGVSTCRVLR